MGGMTNHIEGDRTALRGLEWWEQHPGEICSLLDDKSVAPRVYDGRIIEYPDPITVKAKYEKAVRDAKAAA